MAARDEVSHQPEAMLRLRMLRLRQAGDGRDLVVVVLDEWTARAIGSFNIFRSNCANLTDTAQKVY